MIEIPQSLRADATDLVRDLCACAGDLEKVRDVIGEHSGNDPVRATDLALVVVLLTFGECITAPAELSPNSPAPLYVP